MLVYDELNEVRVSKTNGYSDALLAVEAARELGAPENAGVAVFALIGDDWSVNHNWMISYAYTLIDNGYIPGFIGNTDSSKNFNFGRQCSHYVQFMGDIAQNRTVYWATEPKLNGEPVEWVPYCPSALMPERIDLWSSGDIIIYGDIIANKVYGNCKSTMNCMW